MIFKMIPRSWKFFLGVFVVLRLIFWFTAFPNSDEAYYWLWGQHPDFSYYDHPPLQAWLQGIVTSVFGRSNFALRLPNLFSNVTFFWTYFLILRYLYKDSKLYNFIFVMLLVLASPLYFVFLGLAWHDHLLITFSLVSAYLFIRFLDGYLANGRGETWRLYGSGGAIALAALCKYNAIFVPLGFLATILTTARLRPLLLDRRLYVAVAISLCALIPIAIWNVLNDFQSFQYYFNRSVNPVSPGIKIWSLIGFLGFSFLIVSPFCCIGFYRLLKTRFDSINSIYPSVAFWVFAISSSILTVISLISAAIYYWNITAYLLLFPLLPLVLKKINPHAIFGAILSALIVFHYTVLPLSALISSDATVDPDSRMLFGWKEVAAIVQSQASELNAPLIVTSDYRSASALAYQMNYKNVIAISDRVDQFDFWNRDPHVLKGKDAVIISDDWFPAELMVLSKFESVSSPVTVPVTRLGVRIKHYYVRKGYSFIP